MMTLKTARQRFARLSAKSGDPYDAEVLTNLNGVLEQFQTKGLWKACFVEIALTAYDGIVTLPRQCQSMMFFRKNTSPMRIRNQWFEWLQFGLGFREADKAIGGIFDQGSRFCSFRDFAEPRKLRVKALGAGDATIEVTLQGTTSDGRRIYSTDAQATHPVNGEVLTLVAGTKDTTATFATFEGFSKPVTHDYVEIWTVDPDDATDETLIAVYEPGEEAPQYRRYKVGTIGASETMNAICKLQFVPLASEMDMLLPDNGNAIEMGLMARNFDLESEPERGEAYWAKAFGILNAELARERGGANAPVVFDFDGGRQPKIGAMM